MAIIFRYKNATNLSYAPGVASAGVDGLEGNQGDSGNTVHFIDYDLNNSYIIQLARQKIENNQILSNSSNIIMSERPYKENDLIISTSGNVYKIVHATEISAQNYKFDIQYLGEFHTRRDSIDISQVYIWIKNHGKSNSILPLNRSEKLIDASLDSSDCDLFGFSFIVFAVDTKNVKTDKENNNSTTSDSNTNSSTGYQQFTYTLTIELNNKKIIQGNSIPGEADRGEYADSSLIKKPFNFYKKLEFIDIPVLSAEEYENLNKNPNSHNIDNIMTKYNMHEYYLSDYVMDMLHPSGNNIKCTLSINNETNEACWYKIDANNVNPELEFSFKNNVVDKNICALELNEIVAANSEISGNIIPSISYTQHQLNELTYLKNYTYISDGSNSNPGIITPEILIADGNNNCVGEDLTMPTIENANNNLSNNEAELLQFSQSHDNHTLYRCGDSAFFSSMVEGDVIKNMISYLGNESINKYTLITKNNVSREFVESPVSLNIKQIQEN